MTVERTSEYLVRTACERMNILSHSAVQVKCKIHTKPFKEDTTLVFEPDDNPQWPEGLEVCDTLVQMRKGAQPNITLSVQNPTDHNIMLTGRVTIGTAQSVTSVYPLSAVKEAHSPVDINNIQAQHTKDQETSA